MGNAIIPTRAQNELALPLRWRVYLRLQVLGAALDWRTATAPDLAAYFGCNPDTVRRGLRWLVSAGYLQTRTHSGRHGGRIHAYKVVIDEHPTPTAAA